MKLSALLRQAAERWPERPLLVGPDDGRRETCYREFETEVGRLAASFAESGVEPGDGALVVLPNVPEMLYTWFALARVGAVMLPLDPRLPCAEVEPLVRRLAPRAVIATAADLDRFGATPASIRVAVGSEVPPGALPFAELLASGLKAPPEDGGRPSDPCTVLRTSGTTNRPKAAVLSHRSYVQPARQFRRWMEVTPRDRFFACLPLFHMAGQAFAVSAVAAGASLVLVKRFSGQRFWAQIRGSRATLVRHLGEMLAVLCGRPESPDDRKHHLRAVYGGGAPRQVAVRFERRFGVPVVEGYGLTETNTVLRNELRRRRPGSIGRRLPYAGVRVADEWGTPLGPGVVGEIQVRRNPVMMRGYLGDREMTRDAFAQEWFRTGDLGYRDREGWFYFVGRSKNVIRRRGEMILPEHVEEVLNRHPAIAESAVVGVEDRYGGEEVKAYLVLRDGHQLPPAELVKWCTARLAAFEIPRFWSLCTELPRTATNKIRRQGIEEAVVPQASFDRLDLLDPGTRAPTIDGGDEDVRLPAEAET